MGVAALASTALVGCGSTEILSTPIANIDNTPRKASELTEKEMKNWFHADLVKDTIPGMSVDKAYAEIIKGKKGTSVIVAVVDSGIDIHHEDLKNVLWTNKKEIPNNGKDDDGNGFVDDVNGWNFIGPTVHETLEMTRIIRGDKSNPDFAAAKAAYDKDYQESMNNKTRYEQMYQGVADAHETIKKHLKKDTYTKEDVAAIQTEDEGLKKAVMGISQMFQYGESIPDLLEEIKGGIDYFAGMLNYNLNKDFDGRKELGDDHTNYAVKVYGDKDVITDMEHALHGTHVAGIIGAERNNGKGMNGVANNVQLMAVRVVPDGDEYDKDVALGIIYAVDNGAKVINTSFGKDYSPNKKWVEDAIKYAAKHDVLIVNAAGNDAANLDKTNSYPTDAYNNGPEFSDTFLTVGALNFTYGGNLVANFSNYGSHDVDVFAPGVEIYSTAPDNKYEFLQGTSMASPAVAGVAALVRSQFPKLKAAQVKKIIMQSGLSTKTSVSLGDGTTAKLAEVSTTGKMVNAYNALILASKVASGKVSL